MGVALGMVGDHGGSVEMFKAALALGDPREAEVLSPEPSALRALNTQGNRGEIPSIPRA